MLSERSGKVCGHCVHCNQQIHVEEIGGRIHNSERMPRSIVDPREGCELTHPRSTLKAVELKSWDLDDAPHIAQRHGTGGIPVTGAPKNSDPRFLRGAELLKTARSRGRINGQIRYVAGDAIDAGSKGAWQFHHFDLLIPIGEA